MIHTVEGQRIIAQTHSLFLVEDHPVMRRALRRLVEEEPDLMLVGEAETAEDALIQLPELAPDLVLVDLSLPGMSGLQLIKRLQLEQPALRCLVVTGHVDPLYQQAAIGAGAKGYVTKDDPDEVLEAIRAVLEAE